jgi:protein tyrosine phosphatase (PTP) superfamily phosphohydrolase (DUF442 family)
MSASRLGQFLLALFVFLLLGCGHCPNGRVSLHPPASLHTLPQQPIETGDAGLSNFGFVTRDVWRGAEPSPEALQTLAKLGLKTVIDLRENGTPDAPPPGVRIVHIPVSAWHADRVDPARVLAAIADNPKPLFIHCCEGRDRTGLAIAEYRLSLGMNANDACRELRNFHVNLWWQIPIQQKIFHLEPLLRPKPSPALKPE